MPLPSAARLGAKPGIVDCCSGAHTPVGAHEPLAQLPQLPPQPSSPHVRAAHCGVQLGDDRRRAQLSTSTWRVLPTYITGVPNDVPHGTGLTSSSQAPFLRTRTSGVVVP